MYSFLFQLSELSASSLIGQRVKNTAFSNIHVSISLQLKSKSLSSSLHVLLKCKTTSWARSQNQALENCSLILLKVIKCPPCQFFQYRALSRSFFSISFSSIKETNLLIVLSHSGS